MNKTQTEMGSEAQAQPSADCLHWWKCQNIINYC